MLSLYSGLPSTIEVQGEIYEIKTDFRVWLKAQLEGYDVISLFPSTIPPLNQETENAIIEFANGGLPPQLKRHNQDALPEELRNNEEAILDFSYDAGLIYAAFMQTYNIDLLAIEHLHWHVFLALLFGLPDNTKLSTIMSIRQYDGNDEHMRRLKSEWELPTEHTHEELRAAARFEDLFEKGGD